MERETLKNEVRAYIREHIFGNDSSTDFNDDTRLVSSRLMDSIITLKMINHFEDELKIECKAHEVTADNLDSVNIFTTFLWKKLGR